MGLPVAIEGSDHTVITITWKDEDDDVVDLTDATITGKMRVHDASAAATDIGGGGDDGTLAVTDATAGEFTWTYGANNIGTVGTFNVQFIATYSDTSIEKCFIEQFVVKDALDI